jgi:hypothetical protein
VKSRSHTIVSQESRVEVGYLDQSNGESEDERPSKTPRIRYQSEEESRSAYYQLVC